MGVGVAEAMLTACTVDVNVPVESITTGPGVVTLLESTESEDAGSDEGFFGLFYLMIGVVAAGGDSTNEHHALWLAIADFLADHVQTERSAE